MKTLIIGLSGKKQSGKSTIAHALFKAFGDTCRVEGYAFADELKRICMKLFGLTHAQCYGSEAEKNSLTRQKVRHWFGIDYCSFLQELGFDPSGYLTARQVLQQFGTDHVRNLDDDAWVNACMATIEEERPDIAIVDDVRFPNEVYGIQRAGGVVWRLLRNSEGSDTHPSETALDDYRGFDCILSNHHMTPEQQAQIVTAWVRELL